METKLPLIDRLVRSWRTLLLFALLSVVCLLFTTNVFNHPISTEQDGWIFNSEFTQFSYGRHYYTDIFEIKDPVYLYTYGIFRWIFGTSGPMICETLVSFSLIGLLIALGRRFQLSLLAVGACVLLFMAYYFNGANGAGIFFPFNTYDLALVLFFSSLLLASSGRYLWAGVAFAVAVFAKMPMATFAPAALAMVLIPVLPDWRTVWLRFRSWMVGAVSFTVALSLFLLLRGELTSYIQAVKLNFSYSGLLAQTLGIQNHPFLRTETVLGRPLTFTLVGCAFVIVILATLGLTKQWSRLSAEPIPGASSGTALWWTTLFCGIGATIILYEGVWFNHYFENLSPVVFLVPLSLMVAIKRYVNLKWVQVLVPVAVFSILAGVMGLSNFATASAFQYRRPSLAFRHDPPINPDLTNCLSKYPFFTQQVTYAEVGTNVSVTACTTPPNMKVDCRLLDQFPFLGKELINQFQSCI